MKKVARPKYKAPEVVTYKKRDILKRMGPVKGGPPSGLNP
jgi:hypothetical protein